MPKSKSSTAASTELAHTDERAPHVTTRDSMDAGVPMIAGQPDEPIGPEDALGPGPTRGDYSDRLVAGPAMRTEVIPADEREENGPLYRLVPQNAPEVGDSRGKGGVSTPEAEAFFEAQASAPVSTAGVLSSGEDLDAARDTGTGDNR